MAGDTDFLSSMPQGWLSSKLGDISDVTKLAGYEFTKHIEYDEGGEIIALRALNVNDGRLDLTSVKRISKRVSDSLPRSKLRKNDILLTYTGTVGQVAVVDLTTNTT
jgi:type I restriction enzyme S subunit